VEPGRYLCEVRAGQYWRVEKLKGFEDFLERRFPESKRKAYYLVYPLTPAAAGAKAVDGIGMDQGAGTRQSPGGIGSTSNRDPAMRASIVQEMQRSGRVSRTKKTLTTPLTGCQRFWVRYC
jgi:hypothetical protein